MNSLIIPVYKNEANLPRLLRELARIAGDVKGGFEVVFVVDGSPDACYEILARETPGLPLETQLLTLSRNFGSFAAITAGMERATGERLAVMAADLQEPPELALSFFEILASGRADVVFGVRGERSDPLLSELSSRIFWEFYARFVMKDMPRGGVDVFGCTREVRDRLLEISGTESNLIALLFWIGFRREYVVYPRRPRLEGKSAWSVGKKLRYALDSIFDFTDLPIRLLLYAGAIGMAIAAAASVAVLWARMTGQISVLGYAPLILTTMFFGALTAFGLGIVGQYVWMGLQVSRGRPRYIIAKAERTGPSAASPSVRP
jgi:glycosyltransferase involved in cell wall biosynthesis